MALSTLTGCEEWGPITSSYKGEVRVSATGLSSLVAHTEARNSIDLRDPNRDGNSVYAKTLWYFQVNDCTGATGCVTAWKELARSATPEIENARKTFLHRTALRVDSPGVRVTTVACAQMGWPVPNSCSNYAFVTLDY